MSDPQQLDVAQLWNLLAGTNLLDVIDAMTYIADNGFAVPASGSTPVFDQGFITATLSDVTTPVAQNAVCAISADPNIFNSSPGGAQYCVSSAPPRASGLAVATTVVASDSIQLIFDGSTLNALSTDGMDVSGFAAVYDLAGANCLTASFTAATLSSGSPTATAALTQITLVGTDLSTDGTSIVSAAGGTAYSLAVAVFAEWD